MKKLDKLTNVAAELRVANMKAKDVGILGYIDTSDEIHISSETFKNIVGERNYRITKRDSKDCPYQYNTEITGIKFIAVSPFLIFGSDINKLKGVSQSV